MRLTEIASQVWKSHYKVLVLLAVLLACNILLIVATGQWLAPQVIEKETLYLQKQNALRAQIRKQGGGARTPEQLYVLASQDLSKFRQTVPEYQDFTGLIEELLVLSNDSRLNITQINYTSEELQQSPLLKFSLSFNVAGEYGQVKRFIHSLEQSGRLLVIRQISLQDTEEQGVKLLVKLETYFHAVGDKS